MNFNQLLLLKKRFLIALNMRVFFTGTSRFRLPTTYYLNGKTFYLHAPPEKGLSNDFINLFLDDEYGIKLLEFDPNTIVDIGANIGLFSQLAGSLFPNAKIHSYEPNPKIHSFLKKNLTQVSAILFSEAVGAEAGMGHSKDLGESRLGVFQKGGDIPMVAFTEVLNRIGGSIDLLKLDCEGGEWDIFENPVPFKNVMTIRMEYHLVDGKTLEDLKKAADRIEFKIVKLEENSGFGIVWMENAAC
jgi:FkbM family methyltransferase